MTRGKMTDKRAPDGGYGWVIVLSSAVSNILVIPVLQGFGLLFRNVFAELEMTATDVSTIINVNAAFGMVLGVWNGPLLKRFGYRKMAVGAALSTFIGLVLTSQAASFTQFILFYGLLPSYGFVALLASMSLAVNTYFKERRSFASGVCMTLTGLGPIIMPLVISALLKVYGVRGTALLISGLVLHVIPAALLLHPVSWHPRPPPHAGEEEECKEALQDTPRKTSLSGVEGGSVWSLVEPEPGWCSTGSVSSLHRTSHPTILRSRVSVCKEEEEEQEKEKQAEKKSSCWKKVVKLFDLDLLLDPVYFNIWLGMSIAFTGEINFSLLTPLILGDRGFDIEETARLMAVLAAADILFRFIAPFVGKWLGWPPRGMYCLALVLLITSRTILTLCEGYTETQMVCALLGVAKGFRTVYMALVIPNHVCLEKLPSASSLQTVLNGILITIGGPLIGYLRDLFGNFNTCIYLINFLTFTTLVLWFIEFIIYHYRKKKSVKTLSDAVNS